MAPLTDGVAIAQGVTMFIFYFLFVVQDLVRTFELI
jgi:hypothetical protein